MQAALGRVLTLIAGLSMAGCVAMNGIPDPVSTERRLAMIPLASPPVEKPVTIYWSREQVPFIEAQTDRDAAFALGLVHAHLRLGQIETLRRVSQGRLTEIAGPLGRVRDIQQALRIIDLGKSSDQVYAQMAPDKKAFLDSFVAGLNYYQQNVAELPPEFALLGIEREPWRPQEILTIGRLASIDVSWLVWFRLLPLRDRPDWPQLWAEALQRGTTSEPSVAAPQMAAAPQMNAALRNLNDLLVNTARIGSNSFAVGGGKTQSRAAIIASDPHLGLNLPNMWLLAGFKSPSYHAAGFMIPGLPFVAVGRNENIAWGGTNLHSAASDLIDISRLPADQITSREVDVKVRWWFDDKLTIRESPYGPVISDAAIVPKHNGEAFALKWIGHRPSDEFSAMLSVNRATNWNEFRSGLENFAISAQNFIYADASGNVGQLTATHLPDRSLRFPADVVLPSSDIKAWDRILTPKDLPQIYNPADGFVASANNKPAETPYPIGYFFSGDDRVLRFREMLKAANNVTADDIKAVQRDTYMRSSARLRDALIARAHNIPDLAPGAQAVLQAIASWDARYEVESKGAVAFEATAALLIPTLVGAIEQTIIDTGGSEYMAYAEIIEKAPPGTVESKIAVALAGAERSVAAYSSWGDKHALELRHTFGMIPLIGGRYRFGEVPWPGSSETIWRAGHGLSSEKVNTGFGSQARHISDLADQDSNWFALLGGNDGWINSANFIDQVDMFRTGAMIQMPLRLETVKTQFPYRTTLAPN